MNATKEDKSSAVHSCQEREPSGTQFLRIRGRAKSPPLKNRVIIYDPEKKSLEVRSKKQVDHGKLSHILAKCADSGIQQTEVDQPGYTKIQLPSRINEITLFVDPDAESEPTTENGIDGHSTVMLAKLYLNRLGTTNQILRFLGQLSTLYVTKIRPCDDRSSLVPSSQ